MRDTANNGDHRPGYVALLRSGELERRVRQAERMLAACRVCPRHCDVDRLHDERGICASGALPVVAHHQLHFGEEPILTGQRGSGTIFFGNCNLRCIFCQNYQISQRARTMRDHECSWDRFAEMMLDLQERGAHNINFVSPSHFVPHVIRGIWLAAQRGLRLPLVYNSNGYDTLESLALLDGLIDIYLPDIKYGEDAAAEEYSAAPDYWRHSRAAVREMYRQVGLLRCDADGVARRGLIVRHLVMPRNVARTYEVLRFIAQELSPEVTISIMAQYYPTNRAVGHPVIGRSITAEEYDGVQEIVDALGLRNGWMQQHRAAEHYRPDFQRDEVFR